MHDRNTSTERNIIVLKTQPVQTLIAMAMQEEEGTSTRKRIVIHLQLPTAETVEHESDIYQCKKCGKVFSAPVPNALPRTEFDILTAVFLSYMSIKSKMSVDDMKDMLRLFGINVSPGSITNSMKRLKEYLGPYYSELEEKVSSADARYKDETSHRHNGKNFWVWVIATEKWVYYTIESRRSHKVAKDLGSANWCRYRRRICRIQQTGM